MMFSCGLRIWISLSLSCACILIIRHPVNHALRSCCLCYYLAYAINKRVDMLAQLDQNERCSRRALLAYVHFTAPYYCIHSLSDLFANSSFS